MNTETTSLVPVNSAPAQWGHYARFLQRPVLPEPVKGFQPALWAVLRMLALDLAIMVGLLSIVLVVVLFGVELPKNALNELDLTLPIILGIVIAAPVMEEIAFRSWLSGKLGQILALVLALGGLITASAIHSGGGSPVGVAVVGIGAVIAALVILVLLWKRPPMQWFANVFPLFFWLSTAVFALIHMLNYEEGNWYALLPLVLPQFVLGSICAYLRVHHGLWSAMLLHSLHNGLIVMFVMSATQFAV